ALISTFMRVLLVRGTAIETPVRRPARTSRPICSSTCPRSSTSGACRLRNGRGNHTHTPARSATDTRSRAHAFAPIPYDPRQAVRNICTWAPDPRPDPLLGVPPPDGTHALSSFIFPAPPRWDPWRTEKPRHGSSFGAIFGEGDPRPGVPRSPPTGVLLGRNLGDASLTAGVPGPEALAAQLEARGCRYFWLKLRHPVESMTYAAGCCQWLPGRLGGPPVSGRPMVPRGTNRCGVARPAERLSTVAGAPWLSFAGLGHTIPRLPPQNPATGLLGSHRGYRPPPARAHAYAQAFTARFALPPNPPSYRLARW